MQYLYYCCRNTSCNGYSSIKFRGVQTTSILPYLLMTSLKSYLKIINYDEHGINIICSVIFEDHYSFDISCQLEPIFPALTHQVPSETAFLIFTHQRSAASCQGTNKAPRELFERSKRVFGQHEARRTDYERN